MDINKIKDMKGKEKISVVTCYDYSFAKIIDTKVDMILVGDSLGNVVLGYDRTKHVTMEDMIRHLKAVKKGAKNTFIIADLPFGSYNNELDAISNAKSLISNGADAVKPEGVPKIVKALTKKNINVMGHLGLLPQTAEKMKIVGKDEKTAQNLKKIAKELEDAGAFSVVLESIPNLLAKEITKQIKIPTIGIGAGKEVDGQVLVLYDLLGLYPDFEPSFAKKYMSLKEDISKAINNYSNDIKKHRFPK